MVYRCHQSVSLSLSKCQLSIGNIRSRVMLRSRHFSRWSCSELARFQTELELAARPAAASSGSDRFRGHPSASSRARTGTVSLHAQTGSTVISRSSRTGTGQARAGTGQWATGAHEPGIGARHGTGGAERRVAEAEMGRGKTGRASVWNWWTIGEEFGHDLQRLRVKAVFTNWGIIVGYNRVT